MTTVTIDLGGTAVKLGTHEGAALHTDELPTIDAGIDLDILAARVDALLDGRRPTGVGIAVPGVVDPAGTRLLGAHGKYADLHGRDLAAWGRTRFGAATIVENDARAALIGEVHGGVADGATDAVLITLGTGIGTAALVDGQVLRGPSGHAGILGGHVTVDLDGPACPCGNTGCAEAIASTWALAARSDAELGPALADRRARSAIGLRDLVDLHDHDATAGALLDRFVQVWAAVIVTACHAVDPTVVVVTGGAMRAVDLLLPRLRDHVHAHLWSTSPRPALRTPTHPETSVLRGLAALAGATTSPRPEGSR